MGFLVGTGAAMEACVCAFAPGWGVGRKDTTLRRPWLERKLACGVATSACGIKAADEG